MEKTNSIWAEDGKDKSYKFYRVSDRSGDLRAWVDKALFEDGLIDFLDKNYCDQLRNEDFYGRLWELEILEWLNLRKLELESTHGKGPDFCVKLSDGKKVWIEAVLARPDEALRKKSQNSISKTDPESCKVPNEAIALRYSSSLVAKAEKIYKNYSIPETDYIIIAISAFPYREMWPDLSLFMPAILPIEFQLVYFSTDGSPLDESVPRQTHSVKREYEKETGALVKKEFLYPGDHFPFIDGVIFSEASNLQQLLGTSSTAFDDTTSVPHLFPNYSGKILPDEFTGNFYYHKMSDEKSMISMELVKPIL